MSTEGLEPQLDQFRADFERLKQQIGTAIIGQGPVIDAALTALIGGGHVLLEGMPGLGKSLLARRIAESVGLDFRRIQFTSDLMPADVIGTYVVMESHGRRKFEFQQGPIFTNVLLADEINRATPKTQAALLEGLQDHAVSVANEIYDLPVPFFVVATQSESDTDGTFPLPETELDRFFFHVRMPFPSAEDLQAVLLAASAPQAAHVAPVINGARIVEMSQIARQAVIADDLARYVANVVLATHPGHPLATPLVKRYVRRGSSPRGGLAMIMAAKVRALLGGRVHVAVEDLREVAPAALRHRLALSYDGHAERVDRDRIVQEIVESVRVG